MLKRAFLSGKLIKAIRDYDEPIHKIAIRFDLNPVQLSRYVNRVETIRIDDGRIKRIGNFFGIKDVFDEFVIVQK